MNHRSTFAPLSLVGSFLVLALAACSAGAPGTESADPQASTAEAIVGSSCTVATDCKGILPDICEKCSDGTTSCEHFVCTAGKCAEQICPPAAPPPQCKVATDCKGALPDLCKICPDGSTACAHHECDNGTCEIAYCPPPPPKCTKAADCTGPLPQLCQKCSNGTTECAHHACVGGVCETAICN